MSYCEHPVIYRFNNSEVPPEKKEIKEGEISFVVTEVLYFCPKGS